MSKALSNLATFCIPEDEKLLAAIGTVSIVHAQLDHIMKMTIKTLTGLSPREVRQALHRTSSSEIRERVNKIAKARLGEGTSLLRIQGWVNRHRELTERRNHTVHSLIGKPLGGDAPILYGEIDDAYKPMPSTAEVQQLVTEMACLMSEINFERLHGFLPKALEDKPAPKAI